MAHSHWDREAGPGDMRGVSLGPGSHCWWDTLALVDSMGPWVETKAKWSKATKG